MGFDLHKIQNIVQEYANVISQVSGVDVEVVDNTLFRIAGTGIYASGVNIDMSDEGHVYKHILNTGKTQIIYCPGEDSLCRGCPNRSNCKETIEVSMPIKSDEEIIGIIGLVGSTLEQKEIILKNESLYLEFIKQIAYFIAAKAKEAKEKEISYNTISILDSVINFMDQGVLLISKDSIIMSGNQSARKYLGISDVEGKEIKITSTGDSINNTLEYKLTVEDKDIFAIGAIYPLEIKSDLYNNIFIFKNMKQVQADLYEVTSTLKTLETKNIIGGSDATNELKYNIRKVAGSKSTVLITGESGTGKEMVATAIWRESERRNQKFVAVNCAAIPESLLESELFGYVKGAFSGADPRGRIGKFELANHGIIFLDEIGDMPIYLQGKLLRVLQEKSITRIGSNQVIPIDVRVIAATNKDLKEMMLQKKFREDLYYRLNVIPINIQPLRERPQDIEELVKFFIDRYVLLLEKEYSHIQGSTMSLLENHYWKGNVRELENTIEFMVNMMEADGILDNKTLPSDFFEDVTKKDNQGQDYYYSNDVITLKDLEKREVTKASIIFGDSTEGKKQAADSLGISLATYYRKLREYLGQ
ncbi:sigma-54 interaction domain-containing protein [Gudongella sp. SC589]|jgi:transcriptional regulator with PAS, ATPase and Fis domain|uniref:sigma-54 interaction domain-containing protein n=1 Tax=Gudongella sp. SC589 TaxID=3385990 RepID=UPI0039047C0D